MVYYNFICTKTSFIFNFAHTNYEAQLPSFYDKCCHSDVKENKKAEKRDNKIYILFVNFTVNSLFKNTVELVFPTEKNSNLLKPIVLRAMLSILDFFFLLPRQVNWIDTRNWSNTVSGFRLLSNEQNQLKTFALLSESA